MKKGFYLTLAWNGIKKNKKLYLPYILTCMGTIMMCYIISFLSTSSTFASIRGGMTVQSFLGMGVGVMAVFSLIFLFYTNSFLIRRRKKEFGLYNILGLGKRHLAVVLFLETFIIAAITILGGLFFGILFSKLAELGMVWILGGTATFDYRIGWKSMSQTGIQFAGIFVLIFVNTLWQIRLTNPIQLLHSENAGEKPPKANWILALLGVGLLAAAYTLAVKIQDPVAAIMIFFIAVVMVVIATYLLFVAGSVTLCRILQKNKKYYYQTRHFVSVSSMAYRMKRNGAGLASICILCTMVLVMVSSTVCLYIGAEDSLRNRYPRNINVDVTVDTLEAFDGENLQNAQALFARVTEENGAEQENILSYRTAAFGAVIEGNRIYVDESLIRAQMSTMANIWQVFLVPLADYNQLMGKEEVLSPGEVILYTSKEVRYAQDTVQIGDMAPLTVVKRVDDFVDNGIDSMQIFPTMYLFLPDFNAVVGELLKIWPNTNTDWLLHWFYGFDLSCDDETQIQIQKQIREQLTGVNFSIEGVAEARDDFFGMYAGLFFLGVLLGIVFIFAAVLILYYKQISEGYEDQSRFEIMQKIGMTKWEIRQSINSQILTVFFLPLIMAGVHLAFAFPLIQKLLLIFGLTNVTLLVTTTCCCYLVFALFYLIVYRGTSRSYFAIVSGMREEA